MDFRIADVTSALMNYSNILHLVSGLLLFGVACYSLRLGSFFVTERVRGTFFIGLSLLTVLYLFFSGPSADSAAASRLEIVYSLFSALLLVAMAHLEILVAGRIKGRIEFKRTHDQAIADQIADQQDEVGKLIIANDGWSKAYQELQQKTEKVHSEMDKLKLETQKAKLEADRLRAEAEKLRTELANKPIPVPVIAPPPIPLKVESAEDKAMIEQLKKSNATLASANDELQKLVTAMQTEATEQKKSVTQLVEANEGLAGANRELLQTTVGLQEQVVEQKKNREHVESAYQDLLESSRQVLNSRSNTACLRNIETLLDSVHGSVSTVAQNLTRSNINRISQLSRQIQPKSNGARNASKSYAPARRIPASLAQVAKQLTDQQVSLAKTMRSVKQKIQHIQEIVAVEVAEDTSAVLSSELGEAVINGEMEYLLRSSSTETGTAANDPNGSSAEDGVEESEETNVESDVTSA